MEAQCGARLKKGIEYCNLGAAQLMQGKVAEAYRSYELAEQEDHAWGLPSHAGTNIMEAQLLFPACESLLALVAEFVAAAGLPAWESRAAEEFWVRITREDRLHLRRLLPDLLHAAGDTPSGRTARLSLIKGLTTATESILRRKHAPPAPRANEQELLRREFGGSHANHLFHVFLPAHGKVDSSNLDSQLRDALFAPIGHLTRAMIVFYVARNYAAHYLDSAVECLRDDGTFRRVLQHLAYFITRAQLAAPSVASISYARLAGVPRGNVTSDYAMPVWAVTSPSYPPDIMA